MNICSQCESNAITFFKFKSQVHRAQKSFSLPIKELGQSVGSTDQCDVFHTLDIVKNFIERHSVQSIIEDDEEQRLIIGRPFPEEEIYVEKEQKVIIIKEENVTFQDESCEDESSNVEFEADEHYDDTLDQSSLDGSCDDNIKVEKVVQVKPTTSSLNVEFIDRQRSYEIDGGDLKKKFNKTLHRNIEKMARTKARLRGEQYTTIKGKVIRGKKMKGPCKEDCRIKCRQIISEEDRERNFKDYWALGSVILQRKFVFEHRITMPIKRRRSRNLQSRPRDCSSQYYLDKLNSNGTVEKVHVCETMFSNTLDICKNFIAYLHKQVKTGVVQDRRAGRPQPTTAGHDIAIDQIKANRFHPIEKPVPISKLYEQYIIECAKKEIAPVKSSTYRNLFKKYNECHFLKSDTALCKVCNDYMRANEDDQASMSDRYEEHLNRNEKCLHRAKRRARAAQRRAQRNLSADDDMIIEEHLCENDEN